MTSSEPWYVTAFSSDYREVYPHRDLESARQEVAHLLEKGLEGPLLDLCCGFGRHSLALAEAGIDVRGVDLSGDLLVQARELPGGELLTGRLLRADARYVPFADGSFQGLVNLFSSFGYFGEEGDAQVLDEIARLLRPGGRAVMDLMNPPRIRARLVPRSRKEQGGMVLEEVRSLSPDGQRVTKEVLLTLPGGEQRRWREDVRMYAREEIEPLLAKRGLEVLEIEGSFAGDPAGPAAERQILHIRKA